MEEWRDIPGYEGLYQVSDIGRIKSLKRTTRSRKGRTRTVPENIRKLHPDRDGYLKVLLSRNAIRSLRFVHQLVLEAFIGPRPEGLEGCHSDGNNLNNTPANLRWDTFESNMSDRDDHETTAKGSTNGCAKLIEKDILRIREKYATGDYTQKALGLEYGVSQTAVWYIVNRTRWTHV